MPGPSTPPTNAWATRARSARPPGKRHALPDRHQEATAYAVMKWPSLAAHSRASLAESLATVTPALTRPGTRNRPDQRELRTALYQHAFNPARPAEPGSASARILDWAQQASLPVACLSEPDVLRAALEALTFRLDGSRAAANTIIRKRAVLHGALSYAAEAGLLPDNPLDNFGWRVPHSSTALDPAVYTHCIHGRDSLLNQQIDHVLKPFSGPGPCPSVEEPAACTDRATTQKPTLRRRATAARRLRTPSAMRP
jgi:hypothetical protein